MSDNIVEYVYNGRDNLISLRLSQDDEYADISACTRMVLEVLNDGIDDIDSDVIGEGTDGFDWTTDGEDGIVHIKLGLADLVAGWYDVRLIVYDAANLNGIVWNKEPLVIVIE